jgi:tetratricopeptide (TPR) repeat protein
MSTETKGSRLLRFSSVFLLVIILSTPAFSQRDSQRSQLDGNEALFTVMAALNAAGYDADLNVGLNQALRKQVRDWVTAKNLPSVEELRAFLKQHHRRDPVADLNQYISFALTLDSPPDFAYRFKPNELPPDVNALAGLETLIVQFYREANVAELWKRAQPIYDQEIERYHGPVTKALLQVNGYLRNPTSGYLGRRFQIYIDLLAPPSQVQSRSFKDDYFVVVTPSPDPQFDQVRHAYLHYVLDPLALKFFLDLNRVKGAAEYASAAPALGEAYKDDFTLLATECLILAVESRLAPSSKRQEMIDRDLAQGYVLTPAFAEGLAEFERQPLALRMYYPDLMNGVDLKKEEKRLNAVKFAPAQRPEPKEAPQPEPVLTRAAKMLAEAEELYRAHDNAKARELYLRVLQDGSARSDHARAYYGLARIASLEKDPELAEKLFQKSVDSSPDDETKSWALLYLGRLADSSDRRDEAVQHYKNALAVAGVPKQVKDLAEKGIQEPFTRKP